MTFINTNCEVFEKRTLVHVHELEEIKKKIIFRKVWNEKKIKKGTSQKDKKKTEAKQNKNNWQVHRAKDLIPSWDR